MPLILKDALPTPESPYVPTDIPHVWLNRDTGKYLFEDEANQFDSTEYARKEDAHAALKWYCERYL